jgi:hypothetical protein
VEHIHHLEAVEELHDLEPETKAIVVLGKSSNAGGRISTGIVISELDFLMAGLFAEGASINEDLTGCFAKGGVLNMYMLLSMGMMKLPFRLKYRCGTGSVERWRSELRRYR